MSKRLYIEFFTDPGHGWIRVPVSTLRKITPDLNYSHYSYMIRGLVFLEEDRDAGKFIKAAEEAGYEVKITERNTNHPSPIRNYPSFDPTRVGL